MVTTEQRCGYCRKNIGEGGYRYAFAEDVVKEIIRQYVDEGRRSEERTSR